MSLPRAARRVQAALHELGVDAEVVVLEDSARTAAEAAAAVGVEQGAIVKSLVFRSAGGEPVLVLVSGDNRCDEALLDVTRADAATVREASGYAIGGVPPVGHPAPLHTVIDPRLGRFATVWAAAGTPHAVFPIAYDDLVRVTGGEVRPVSRSGDDGASAPREWLPDPARRREREILHGAAGRDPAWLDARVAALIERNRAIHDRECINLNPATNVMNPRAEAALSAGLGSRPSLGYAGAKYEMGLEAIEEIEVLAADLACRVFGAAYAEVRVGSGALANAYGFLATCRPGDAIIVPPASIGGHATHHGAGVAGLLGLDIHEMPIDAEHYTADVDGLAALAERVRPKLITIGGSLNLLPHPVAAIRSVADRVGARVLFDAAHLCGLIAGGVWPNPLAEGADILTMSTYKSLGGPPGGLVLTGDAELAQRIDRIAFPGLTANFDAGKTAALAIGLLDWLECGRAYAETMVAHAAALAGALAERGLPVFTTALGPTRSHQLAIDATAWGGGDAAARRLREANLLACAIGLPDRAAMAGLRLGTPEVVRRGMPEADMATVAGLLARALSGDPGAVAAETTALRRRYDAVRFVRT